MATVTDEDQKELFAKFLSEGLTEKAALECTAVAVIYNAFVTLSPGAGTDACALLTLAVANSLAKDD